MFDVDYGVLELQQNIMKSDKWFSGKLTSGSQMTYDSRVVNNLVQYLNVIQHIKTIHLNCLPHLNKNEFADKTAPINFNHQNQPIRIQKHS